MKIQVTAHNKTTTIETESDDINMEDTIYDVVIPILTSLGFAHETIMEYIVSDFS